MPQNKGCIPWNKGTKGKMPIPWNKKFPNFFKCHYCKKEFKNLAGHSRKFCGFKCYGLYRSKVFIREKHPNWKGGKLLNYFGYIYIHKPTHPFCDHHGYILEHRLMMEKHLGRYLKLKEIIHHRNGIKTDNRISNLKLFHSISEHRKYHIRNKKA